jgi:hypothetical protein
MDEKPAHLSVRRVFSCLKYLDLTIFLKNRAPTPVSGNKKGRPVPAFDVCSGNYLVAAASVDAASLAAAFFAFLAFFAFFIGAAAVSVVVDDAAGAEDAVPAACGAAKAERANREATRPAISLDISDSFREKGFTSVNLSL